MKKHLIIIAAALFVITTTVITVSCQKDTLQETKNQVSKNDVSDSQENMDEYLLAFKKKLQNAEKGDETMTLEQAQNDLSNLLNFDFGDASYATDVFKNDTLFVKVASDNGMVDLSQLSATYSDAFDQILTSYRTLDLEEKSVYSIYCEYEGENSKDGDDDERMKIIVTYRGFTGNTRDIQHDTLSWQPGRIGTSCDDPTISYGGALNMQNWITNAQPTFSCPNAGRLYFTQTYDWFLHGCNTYDPIAGRYKVFTEFTYNPDTICISHEDMEYYFTNIIDYFEQYKPSGHIVIYVYVDCWVIPYDPQNINGYPGNCNYWRIQIRHGKPNCTDTNPAS